MLVILDIDGTLADNTHRQHFLKAMDGRPDWDAFFKPAAVLLDAPIKEAQRVVRKLQELKYDLVCLTGRDETLRDTTTRWLLEHFNLDSNDFNLLMRPLGSMLPVAEFKAQQMQQLLSEYKTRGMSSFVFIDDDGRNCQVFGAEGVTLKAPDCWALMFPSHAEPEPE